MAAVFLCLGLFAYFAVVGYAAVTALHATRSRVQDVLLAPAVGMAVSVIPVFTLSRLGLPVSRFGMALAIVLLVAAVGVLVWRRPRLPWRAWPFGVALAFGMVMTGQPMVRYGFDWVSFCNDDMANYALAADRFYHHGYVDTPGPDDLTKGKEYANDFWFMHVATRARPGCELNLAWLRSTASVNEHQGFMPLILAFHLALLMAAAGLVAGGGGGPDGEGSGDTADLDDADDGTGGEKKTESLRRRLPAIRPPTVWRQLQSPALAAMAMLGVSALLSLGTLYQLIAQVAGLALLCVNASLLFRPFRGLSRRQIIRHGVLLGITGGGLLIFYPEVFPFMPLAWGMYLVVGLYRKRIAPKPTFAVAGVAVLAALVLTRGYFIDAIGYMAAQAFSATVGKAGVQTTDPTATLFPYYMLPEGLGDFWGFLRLAQVDVDPTYQSTVIAVGGVLLLAAVAATVWLCWRGRPVAFLSAAMFLLAAALFRQRAGFGLFKLAMYMQPFAVGTLALGWLTLWRKRSRWPHWTVVRLAPLIAIAWTGVRGQREYMVSSYGFGSGFLEIPDPSRNRVAAEFHKLVQAHPDARVIVSDTYNVVLAKFQMLYGRRRELVFPSQLFLTNCEEAQRVTGWEYLSSRQAKYAQDALEERAKVLCIRQTFDLHDPTRAGMKNVFLQTDQGWTAADKPPRGDVLFVKTSARINSFNRRYAPPRPPPGTDAPPPGDYTAVPLADVRDHLVFVTSQLGVPPGPQGLRFYTNRDLIPSLYQLEGDPLFFRGDTMTAVNRYLMFEAVRPSARVRLMLNLTCTYASDGDNSLPPAAAVGGRRAAFDVTGRGSMRVFSEPLEPQTIDGRPYYMVDLGRNGRQFPAVRLGLMKLYGTKIPLDRRVIVGFARDVSLVSEDDYQRMAPPARLAGFPPGEDNPLRSPDLEYSGLYEDGWVGEEAYFRLTRPAGSNRVSIAGAVDSHLKGADGHKSDVVLSVDGREVARQTIGLGEFRVEATLPPVPAGEAGGLHTVRVQFEGPVLRMPDPLDNRPVAAQLLSIGFESHPKSKP